MSKFAQKLQENYNKFKEPSLKRRRFKHKDILPLITERKSSIFDVKKAGKSFEGRDIFLLKTGKGETKILLWSQMHGNEPTATQALFDIFNFFENPAELKSEAEKILQNCTLYFIPMLNPDGAEGYQRRNAQEIDINRDALRLEAPESKILMNIRDETEADFGFNLHDQDIWYAAGNSKNPATLSFLAPTYNTEKETDERRKRSMLVIVSINRMLQSFIPNKTAKYNDDFMPTAFGDNIQKRGTSTILIESGGYYNDPEKQFVRKLNFISILHALKVISDQSFLEENSDSYYNIPFNNKNKLFDYIFRNALLNSEFGEYRADIGIRSQSLPDKDVFVVDDIGDLSQNSGYIEKDMKAENILKVNIGDVAESLINEFLERN
ncbi:MAG: hypothetical protein K8R54_02430 [Bacteroidales bacterium]|nr:hypothetical protein [Bacteroidales bacterium]